MLFGTPTAGLRCFVPLRATRVSLSPYCSLVLLLHSSAWGKFIRFWLTCYLHLLTVLLHSQSWWRCDCCDACRSVRLSGMRQTDDWSRSGCRFESPRWCHGSSLGSYVQPQRVSQFVWDSISLNLLFNHEFTDRVLRFLLKITDHTYIEQSCLAGLHKHHRGAELNWDQPGMESVNIFTLAVTYDRWNCNCFCLFLIFTFWFICIVSMQVWFGGDTDWRRSQSWSVSLSMEVQRYIRKFTIGGNAQVEMGLPSQFHLVVFTFQRKISSNSWIPCSNR